MTPDEMKEFTGHLVDAHEGITDRSKWRPRKAAKDLCQEFRILIQKGDFWDQMAKTGDELQKYQAEADEMLRQLTGAKIGFENPKF